MIDLKCLIEVGAGWMGQKAVSTWDCTILPAAAADALPDVAHMSVPRLDLKVALPKLIDWATTCD